jgi:AcrR family transcriptional regulator
MTSVTRKAHTTRQQRREEIQQQLLEGTERLMSEGTAFTELSVDRLAAEAGISRATFYVYFEDKGQLLMKLAQLTFDEMSEASSLWWNVAERREPGDLRAALAAISTAYRRHQSVIAAVHEMATYDSAIASLYRAQMDDLIAHGQAVIERGIADGQIAPLASRETAAALTWMVDTFFHQEVRSAPAADDDRMVDCLTDVIWRTLYLTPAK